MEEQTKVVARPTNGSLETYGYRVEARMGLHGHHAQVGDRIYGNDWSEINVHRAAIGIPSSAVYGRYLNIVDCMSHEQAMAIAWAFKAECEATSQYGVDVRIVRMKVFCSWKAAHDGFVQELLDEKEVNFQKAQIVLPDGSMQEGPDDPLKK